MQRLAITKYIIYGNETFFGVALYHCEDRTVSNIVHRHIYKRSADLAMYFYGSKLNWYWEMLM